MEKRVAKPYKHQEYPKMVFHGTTGKQLICDCEDDIPEGYGALADVVLEDLPDTEDTTAYELKAAYDKGFADCLATGFKKRKNPVVDKKVTKKTEKKPAEKTPEKVKGPTLEGLNITRKEAKEILKEDGIEFASNASDDNLASKIEKLLKDDKSE